jgi:hypothetical protein
MYYCNKCGYCGDAGPGHKRHDGEQCHYHAVSGPDGDSLSVADVVNTVARFIPDGYTLSLHIERGAAWVKLENDEGDDVPLPDAADKSLYQQINDGLARACGWPARGPQEQRMNNDDSSPADRGPGFSAGLGLPAKERK